MNAKSELQEAVENLAKIKCAIIKYGNWEDTKIINFAIDYNETELEEFYDSLDFYYDNGYGGQELYGTVWLEDGTWLSRGEYDGSEWWEHNVCPSIPNELLKK